MAQTSASQKRIIAFDSGLGGLTVVRAIRAVLPRLGVTYVGDNAVFPYGELDEAILVPRIRRLVVKALDAYGGDAVVIACNTASTAVLDDLRRTIDVPVVGVVPAIKPAGTRSRSRVIGLLATEGTVQRPYVDGLIRDFAADCRIVRVGSQTLVRIAEDTTRGRPPDPGEIGEILRPFFADPAAPVDTVVLGCTHFPLVLDALRAAAPANVTWLDPAPAVARRLSDVLADDTPGAAGNARAASYDIVLFTRDPDMSPALEAFLSDLGFPTHAVWPDAPDGAPPRPEPD